MQLYWIFEPEITEYEVTLFHSAMYQHRDYYYYCPIAVAKQEQLGMKYRFLCIAKPWDCTSLCSHLADIEIYKPISGMPYATCLFRLDFNHIFPQRMPYV